LHTVRPNVDSNDLGFGHRNGLAAKADGTLWQRYARITIPSPRAGELQCRYSVFERSARGLGPWAETGARQENASIEKSRAPFRFYRNGKSPRHDPASEGPTTGAWRNHRRTQCCRGRRHRRFRPSGPCSDRTRHCCSDEPRLLNCSRRPQY